MIRVNFFTMLIVLPLILFLTDGIVLADDPPPEWMRQAASRSIPVYEKDVPAVVLLDEELVTLNSENKLITIDNYAVKILNREGRKFAVARAFYLASSGKIKEIVGWIIRPDGTTKYLDKKKVVDIIADRDDVYNEGRIKIIDASDDVDVGYIFGYTIVSEDQPLFFQDAWNFQGRLPTLTSRYSLTLPSGWKATSITFNAPEVKPQISGTAYTWELTGLQPIPPEPFSPDLANISPRISINYSPENSSQAANRVFGDWKDVSRWGSSLHDPQVIVDDNVAEKARELTANSQTELDKIRAIGKYVQNLQYISIDIGVGYGNGYKPRSSSLVLSRGYGDCKDKANLMRALLRALKIDAYPIAIFSGDPTFVREQWVSPRQFNHCILGVRVSNATQSHTIIEHEKVGRLLIFDATDPFTPVGDLPEDLQGSLALIMAGDTGGLIRMPVTPPETNLLERNITVTLGPTGGINGTIRERAQGQSSTFYRQEFRSVSTDDYRKALEGWINYGATGSKLDTIKTFDGPNESTFNLELSFSASGYAQSMQDRILVFKPVIVSRRDGIHLTEPKRVNPIEVGSSSMKETVEFILPVGFIVDEVPLAADLVTFFGKYSTRYEIKPESLIFTRIFIMNRSVLPVEKYQDVKEFFLKMRDAEQSPVVLIRK